MRMAIDEHHQHKDVYEHSLTVLRQAIELEDERPRSCAALGGAAARHRQARDASARIGRRGELSSPRGGRRQDDPQADAGAEVLQADGRRRVAAGVSASALPRLRRRPKWTDSAVRRYVTDAGPLLPRLHKLVRADCTTRNKRRAARLQANYDDLEARITELAAKEDLQRVRPDLDGNEIMKILGIPAGPQVGEAWRYLKELRLDRGPLDHDEAVAELHEVVERQELIRRLNGCGLLPFRWRRVGDDVDRRPLDTDVDGDGALDAVGLDVDGDGRRRRRAGRSRRRRHRRSRGARRRPDRYFTDDGSGTWAVSVDRGGQLRWFGLDGVEHSWAGHRSIWTAMGRPATGCSTSTATGWPIARWAPASATSTPTATAAGTSGSSTATMTAGPTSPTTCRSRNAPSIQPRPLPHRRFRRPNVTRSVTQPTR